MGACYAQVVNIEGKRIHSDTSGFDGSLEAGFSVNQNKSLLFSATTNAHVQYKTKKDLFILLGNWRFTISNGNRFVNDGFGHFRYNHKFKSWLWVEGFGQVQYNELQNLKLRGLVGMGPRFKFVDRKWLRMYTGLLYMFEYENHYVTDTMEYNNRMSTYLSWTLVPNNKFSFVATTYYQPKLTGWEDYKLSGNYALRFKAFRRWSFKVEFNFQFDSTPPLGGRDFLFSGTTGIIFDITPD